MLTPGRADVGGRLGDVSRRLRAVLRADGAAEAIGLAALWAIASMALDWSLEIPRLARVLALVLLGLAAARSIAGARRRIRRPPWS